MTDLHFLEKFLTTVSVLKQYGGTIGRDQGAVDGEIETAGYTLPASMAETKAAFDVERSKFMVMVVVFLHAMEKHQYGKLLDELENYFTKGTGNYPETLMVENLELCPTHGACDCQIVSSFF
jgi:hypothetical protein